MKRMRTAGLCLVAALALSAVITSSAAALGGSAPEIGRCKAKTKGAYSNSGCTLLAKEAAKEKFEWYPYSGKAKNGEELPVVKKGYKSASKAETLIQLEGTGEAPPKGIGAKTKVICKETAGKEPGQTAEGEVTGLKTNKAFNIVFVECESGGNKCKQGAGTAGTIKVENLAGEIGIEAIGTVEGKEVPSKDKLANRFVPETGTKFAEFTCAGLTVDVKGAVLNPISTNKMVLSSTVKFTAAGGSQKPECFLTKFGEKQKASPCNKDPSEGGTEDVLLSKFETLKVAPYEESGQTLTTVQVNDEKLEARVGAE
jgi:hypothetical protein